MNKFFKTLLNHNKGITLIALVITIVILLILAGVSINLTLGDNGIVKKSIEAKEKSELAAVKENVELLKLNKVNMTPEDLETEILNKYPGSYKFDEKIVVENQKYDIYIFDDLGSEVVNHEEDVVEDWHQCDKCSIDNPHIIRTKKQFDKIREHINADGDIDGYFKLGNDIIFNSKDFEENGIFYNDGKAWRPIGSGELEDDTRSVAQNTVKIWFDGNGKTIRNISVFRKQGSRHYMIGVFSSISNATIKNLNLDNIYVEGFDAIGILYGDTPVDGSNDIENIRLSNCKLNVDAQWKSSEKYGSGLFGNQITGTLKNVTLDNCTAINWKETFASFLTSYIYKANMENVNINNCNTELRSWSVGSPGILAMSILESNINGMKISNMNLSSAYLPVYILSNFMNSNVTINNLDFDINCTGGITNTLTDKTYYGSANIQNSKIKINYSDNVSEENTGIKVAEDSISNMSKVIFISEKNKQFYNGYIIDNNVLTAGDENIYNYTFE